MYCLLDCTKPFDEFLSYAKKAQENVRLHGSDETHQPDTALYLISSLPWMTYTSLSGPISHPADSNPRITWGKYQIQNDRTIIPVSFFVNHAVVDGLHIARFYENLTRLLEKNSEI